MFYTNNTPYHEAYISFMHYTLFWTVDVKLLVQLQDLLFPYLK